MKTTCVRVAFMNWVLSADAPPMAFSEVRAPPWHHLARVESREPRSDPGRRAGDAARTGGHHGRDRLPLPTARKVTPMTLLGRAPECDRVDRVLGAARQGLSGVLVLRG